MAKVMDDPVLRQLAELAKAFNNIGIRPVICGGLGIYLSFCKSDNSARNMIRATNDIDLMLTKSQVTEMSRREALAEIITRDLEYIVRDEGRYFLFAKPPDRHLDILAQPVDGFPVSESRVKFVRSKLHGRLTPEARFIDEDLRTINLSSVFAADGTGDIFEVQVPSPTNLLILKLCAFEDRFADDKERAQTHAFDVFITVTLANIEDYQEGQKFLARHGDWQVVQRVVSIVQDKFHSTNRPGWQRVLEARNFYPDKRVDEKRDKLEKAKNRLVRWFTRSE